MNILQQIVAHKRKEVEQRKKEVNVKKLETQRFFPRKTFSLKQFIADAGRTGIISEF